MNRNRILAWLLSLVIGGGILGLLASGPGISLSSAVDDCKSAQTFLESAQKRGDKAPLLDVQWAQAQVDAICGTPNDEPTANPPAPKTNVEEFLANRPVKQKMARLSFGPKFAVLPSLNKKAMDDLTLDQVFDEHLYVVDKVDRMQTAVTGVEIGVISGDVNNWTQKFVDNRREWNRVKALVVKKLKSMDRRIDYKAAYTSGGVTYAVPGKIPQVGHDTTSYSYRTKYIVYTDGKGKEYWFKINCHFQPIGGKGTPHVPPTAPGIIKTPEGDFKPKPKPCEPWKDGTIPPRNDDGSCPKDPYAGPDEPSAHTPAPSPTNPETTAPVEPNPANPTTKPHDPAPSVTAPGAISKPTQSAPPDKVDPKPSQTATGDTDPDN